MAKQSENKSSEAFETLQLKKGITELENQLNDASSKKRLTKNSTNTINN